MYNRNINFAKNNIIHSRQWEKKRSLLYKAGRFLLVIFLTLFVISFALSYKAIFSQETFGGTLAKLPVVSYIKALIGGEDKLSKDNDRLNFLMMGIGGAGHDGALLTDTIMLASVKLSTKEIALLSIPRDLLVKIPNNGWQRINHASAYGELNNYPGGGSALAAKTIEETFDAPINYWVRIDFDGFMRVIDDIGGIDITVERAFTDNGYPTDDHEVQTIHFDAGLQHMDGKTALIFVRSRHGDNLEGSDFARSRRQQKILLAIKDKILNWKTFLNPNRVYSIYDNAKNNIETNIEAWQLPQIVDLFKGLNFDGIRYHIIDDSPGGLLKPMITEDGAAVLAPKAGGLSELQEFLQNVFVINEIEKNNISVIIANGTTIEGLATYTGSTLESWGFNIARLINSPQQDFEKTVIYNLSENDNGEALKIIKDRMQANVTEDVPEFLRPILYKTDDWGEEKKIDAEFLVVVGFDQQKAIQAIKEWDAEQARLAVMVSKEKGKIDEKNTNNNLK
ncbi:MAG: LCP family protein [Candidatus Kuenenbacteria bacterium]